MTVALNSAKWLSNGELAACRAYSELRALGEGRQTAMRAARRVLAINDPALSPIAIATLTAEWAKGLEGSN